MTDWIQECLLYEKNEVKFDFIRDESPYYPASILFRVMFISRTAWYAFNKRLNQLISAETLHLHRRIKELFKQSRNSVVGSRQMMKKTWSRLSNGCSKVRNLMKKLRLKVTQRIAYKVTTKRNHSDDNRLYMQSNDHGWQPKSTAFRTCFFYSVQVSQYTIKRYRKLLSDYEIWASMDDVGAYWDTQYGCWTLFWSLKHDWIFKISQPTREYMRKNVVAYMAYYNIRRLHTANGEQSPINHEDSLNKVSCWTWPVQLSWWW